MNPPTPPSPQQRLTRRCNGSSTSSMMWMRQAQWLWTYGCRHRRAALFAEPRRFKAWHRGSLQTVETSAYVPLQDSRHGAQCAVGATWSDDGRQEDPVITIDEDPAQHSTAQHSRVQSVPLESMLRCAAAVLESCSAPSPPRHVGPSVIANQPSSPGNQNPAPRVANITLHQCISSRTCPGMPVPHAKGDHGGPVPVDGHSSPGQNNNATAQSSGVACRRMAPKS
ncbi:hypothetical protein S40293_11318 [Stachybotrys chartarum IBT 40293]|nr:hypothetical protein S40293_11318 [Stachybotrys chartarum IBT 40293]